MEYNNYNNNCISNEEILTLIKDNNYDNYNKVLEIIKNDSEQSGMSIQDLCSDMSYNMELADNLDITLEEIAAITNKIENEVC